jgi:hypothetical protein
MKTSVVVMRFTSGRNGTDGLSEVFGGLSDVGGAGLTGAGSGGGEGLTGHVFMTDTSADRHVFYPRFQSASAILVCQAGRDMASRDY